MRFIWALIDGIIDYHTWYWVYKNPIIIPLVIAYFIPYFFVIRILDFITSLRIPYISSSTILVVGLIVYTLLTVFIVAKVVLYIDDNKE